MLLGIGSGQCEVRSAAFLKQGLQYRCLESSVTGLMKWWSGEPHPFLTINGSGLDVNVGFNFMSMYCEPSRSCAAPGEMDDVGIAGFPAIRSLASPSR